MGRIDLRDLHAISVYYGREFIPYPFVVRDPERCNIYARRADGADPAPDRFNHGDLRVFRQWFTTYLSADIWVECNVQYFSTDPPSQRILAHRSGGYGFLAIQTADHEVDVFTLPPQDLGSAIAGSAVLTKPGKRTKIVIPEYIPRPSRSTAADGAPAAFSVPVTASATTPKVPESEITLYATAQSHWRPTREWGFDRTKDAAVWVRVKDDGDYLYVPDYSHAKPMTARDLRDSVNRLISKDISALKRFQED
ncbi:hypothetical protein [Mycobacterium sp. MUNTM1]